MSNKKSKNIEKNALMTVTEFANLVDIPVSKLRYYDKKGIFVPAAHGEGAKNKYRYYSPLQITTLKMILVLSEIGIPLETIADLEESREPESMIKVLAKNERIISCEIEYLQDVHEIIKMYHDHIIEGINAEEDEIAVCEMSEVPITLGEPTDFYEGDTFYNEYLNFCKKLRSPKLNLSYPIGGYFESMECFSRQPSEPSRFFSLDPDGRQVKEKGRYLVGYTRGYYGQTNDLPERLKAYAKKHKIVFDGPVYNIYLFDEISTSDPNKYLLQVSASITETHHEFSKHPHRHFHTK